ncbi:hypothetical protein A8924_6705 [Saccharopolyspora erythraea NRRL 2338]|uniref:Cell wall surface anchor family protein n=2 Tax=Saccharopolyspora erythraea TaxID=1836 RepID=A4FNA3_SACEN|nr:DUF6319 family protein [Saccharopolyspora erythraea]EQD87146.1 cell wall anchor [Saccharopolyspora erythraea D]PFG99167.1 hypothetical protein A8924_6705 [Saccharopolyspora erythraea NRRL 2338]QRK89117.1 cell wall anchor protein [Saccharopolyspora erythraea]CAM05528.1 cell wall surface anchor family protein [Saccharopolyspora erythraea NRRL 2338]
MSQARALSSDEVRGLREQLAAGETPTVWFTPAAVGVQEGRSGKVMALDEPAEGDFIQVRPAGSKDVLSFSVGEVTMVKPPRKRSDDSAGSRGRSRSGSGSGAGSASGAGTASGSGSAKGSGSAPAPAKASGSASGSGSAGAASSKPAASSPSGGATSGRSSAGQGTAGSGASRASDAADAARTSSSATAAKSSSAGARRKQRQPTEATVTLTADQAGQWSVEVSTGKKRVLRPMAVPASAVAQAAKALHDDVADAVEPLIDAAREQQRARVEQLQQELADAQRMLDELTD